MANEYDLEKDTEAVGDKVSILMDEGYPQKQAVAIALDMKRRGKLSKAHVARVPLGEGWESLECDDHGGEIKRINSWDNIHWWPSVEAAIEASRAFALKAASEHEVGGEYGNPGFIHRSVEAGRFAYMSSFGSDEWDALPNDKHGGKIGVYEGSACYWWPNLESAKAAYDHWEGEWRKAVRKRVLAEAKGRIREDMRGHDREWRLRRITYAALDCAEVFARSAQSGDCANPMDLPPVVRKSRLTARVGASQYVVAKHQDPSPTVGSTPNLPEPNPNRDVVVIEDDSPGQPTRIGRGRLVRPDSGLFTRKG